jgi:predicted RNA-binding protein with PIN domain
MAYHDALMEGESGLPTAEREMIVVATSGREQLHVLRRGSLRNSSNHSKEQAHRRSVSC